jgi:hypothetical protein
MACNSAQATRTCAALQPMIALAVMQAAAYPNAQAFTSCVKPATRPSESSSSTLTLDPQRGERFFARADTCSSFA